MAPDARYGRLQESIELLLRGKALQNKGLKESFQTEPGPGRQVVARLEAMQVGLQSPLDLCPYAAHLSIHYLRPCLGLHAQSR